MILGFLLGLSRLIANMNSTAYCKSFAYFSPMAGKLMRYTGRNWFVCMHFSYFAFLLASIVAAVTLGVSLYDHYYLGRRQDEAKVRELTIWAAWEYARETKRLEANGGARDVGTSRGGDVEAAALLPSSAGALSHESKDPAITKEIELTANGASSSRSSVDVTPSKPLPLSVPPDSLPSTSTTEDGALPPASSSAAPIPGVPSQSKFPESHPPNTQSYKRLHRGGSLESLRVYFQSNVQTHPAYVQVERAVLWAGVENIGAVSVCVLMFALIAGYR